jgi:hypothetical protein
MRAACAVVAVLAAAACKKPDDAPQATTSTTPTTTRPPAPPAPPAVPAKPGPPPRPFESLDEMATATIAMSEKIGAAVTAANGDCARMGASLSALIGELTAINARSQGIGDDARKREFVERYGKQIQAQAGTWVPLVQKCQADAGVKAFFAAMP